MRGVLAQGTPEVPLLHFERSAGVKKTRYTVYMSHDFLISIFYFVILIFSIIIHEVSHGIAAEREGDPTARLMGRITLNPLKHIDWFGSILLPLILVISKAGFVVGWAKPVPYNPHNVRHGRKSVARIAASGVCANLSIAIVFGLAIRVAVYLQFLSGAFVSVASIIVLVNLVLAFFNSIPLAPLDGFNFFRALLGSRLEKVFIFMERYSLPLLIIFLLFGWRVVAPGVLWLFTLLTGIGLS